jgi:hypothetical protein
MNSTIASGSTAVSNSLREARVLASAPPAAGVFFELFAVDRRVLCGHRHLEIQRQRRRRVGREVRPRKRLLHRPRETRDLLLEIRHVLPEVRLFAGGKRLRCQRSERRRLELNVFERADEVMPIKFKRMHQIPEFQARARCRGMCKSAKKVGSNAATVSGRESGMDLPAN